MAGDLSLSFSYCHQFNALNVFIHVENRAQPHTHTLTHHIQHKQAHFHTDE